MSHFTVLVVGDDVDDLLAPYNEQGEPGDEHMEFTDYTEEIDEEWAAGTQQEWRPAHTIENKITPAQIKELKAGKEIPLKIKIGWGEIKKGEKEVFTSRKKDYHLEVLQTGHADMHIVKLVEPPKDIKHSDKYKTKEEFIEDWYGYEYDEDEKAYGYYSNPISKWDWYQTGGRWAGLIKLRKGQVNNAGRGRGEQSLLIDRDMYPEANQTDSALLKDIDPTCLRNLTTYAILSEDGWKEQNEMGWFGMSSSAGEGKNIPNSIDKEDVKNHLDGGQWGSPYTVEYKKDFNKTLKKYYTLEDKYYVLKENHPKFEEDILHETFYPQITWDNNFQEYLGGLSDDTKITIVDCHV